MVDSAIHNIIEWNDHMLGLIARAPSDRLAIAIGYLELNLNLNNIRIRRKHGSAHGNNTRKSSSHETINSNSNGVFFFSVFNRRISYVYMYPKFILATWRLNFQWASITYTMRCAHTHTFTLADAAAAAILQTRPSPDTFNWTHKCAYAQMCVWVSVCVCAWPQPRSHHNNNNNKNHLIWSVWINKFDTMRYFTLSIALVGYQSSWSLLCAWVSACTHRE